jgi:hypothetical protein
MSRLPAVAACNFVFEIFRLNRSQLQIQKPGHGSCDAEMNFAEVKIVQQPGDRVLYGARGEPCFDGREKAQAARQSALNDFTKPTSPSKPKEMLASFCKMPP